MTADPRVRVRVLVVDSSMVMCNLMAKHLAAADDIDVVGAARDPERAMELARLHEPDVVVIDVLMRGAQGLPSVTPIVAHRAARVVLVSATPEDEARRAVRGIGLGAVEFVAKPAPGMHGEQSRMVGELVAAVRRAAASGRRLSQDERLLARPLGGVPRVIHAAALRADESSTTEEKRSEPAASRLVVIGTSTGGPAALRTVVPNLTAPLDAALIIIQHMPHTFTRSLAKRLDGESPFSVREAEDGELLVPNLALMAPGDYHLVVTSNVRVHLHHEPPLHGVRPSLDVTLESAAQRFGENLLAVILTGMGVDGARGAAAVKARGGSVYAEHSSTAVVYGMPRAVVEQGSADQIVPLYEMSEVISSWIQATTRTARRSGQTTRTPVIG